MHIAARVSTLAGAGEILVTRARYNDLLVGSDIVFFDHGEHSLKGVPDTWRLYAVELAER